MLFFFSLLYKQEIQRYVYWYRRRVSAVRGNVCACLQEQLERGLEKKKETSSILSLSLFAPLPVTPFLCPPCKDF